MNIENVNLSVFMNGSRSDFPKEMSGINAAHEKVKELRQLIYENEATLNLKILFKQLGIEFDNTNSNEDLFKLMNSIDLSIMDARASVRQKDNRGVGVFYDKTKFDNGFNSETLKNWIDLSFLTNSGVDDVTSISNENIEQAHSEIMKLRELIWLEAIKEFKQVLSIDGITLGAECNKNEDYFDEMDKLDLKLMGLRDLKRTEEEISDGSSIYKHGQKATLSPISALSNALQTTTSEEVRDVNIVTKENEREGQAENHEQFAIE